MKTNVSIVKCTGYEQARVFDALERAIGLAGGMNAFVKPGERILLKPNLLSAREPERAVTTHPEVVRALVRLVRQAGATPVVGDSPGGAIKGVDRVWEKTGMKKMAAEEAVELVNFETSGGTEKNVSHSSLKSVFIANAVLEADGIINIPKLKTHNITTFTGAIKNLYGCIPGLRKAEYHKLAPYPDMFARLLAEIYLLLKSKIRLNVMDGIVGMEGSGPNMGDIRKLDMLIASADALALDSCITHLLGKKARTIDTLKFLAEKGAGTIDFQNIQISGDNPSEFSLAGFKFPANWYYRLVPRFLINFLGRNLWMKPAVVAERCVNCMMCVQSCPVKCITAQKGGKPVVDKKRCIICLCCHELCQYNAIELESSALSKIFIRQ